MNVAMILAGGNGRRMGSATPKQFIEIHDKPIIIHTLEKFEDHSAIDAIQIVCIESHINYVSDLVEKYVISKVKWVVPGGSSFLKSVQNGVYALAEICSSDDIVVIHMSVAPFIEPDIITDSIVVCRKNGNAISMNPCLLCMGEFTAPGYTSKSILRETLVGLNTPQSFLFKQIHDSFRKADECGITDNLEPHVSSLMYELGIKLYLSKGSQYNFKITTQEDLDLFEGYLCAKQMKAAKQTMTSLDNKERRESE